MGFAGIMSRDRRKAMAVRVVAARARSLGARGAACVALLFSCAAPAQNSGSVSDYRLPPKSSSTPVPAGPVDSEFPAPAAPAPSPRPTTPAPAETATPAQPILLPPATADTRTRQPEPATRPTREAETQPAARPTAAPALAPASQPTAAPAPAPETPTPDIYGTLPPPVPVEPVPERVIATNGGFSPWLAILAGAALLLIAGTALALRRRRSAFAPAPEETVETASPAPASAPATLTPLAQANTPRKPAPSPAPISSSGPLELRLEPQSLRFSFVYATLTYRLEVINRGASDLAALRIHGDLASGHASIPVWRQLSLDPAQLELKHDLAALAGGETASLKGELRLPLADVLPLQAGQALLYAPLARFLLQAERAEPPSLAEARVFSIGLPSDRRSDTMQPFRLDLGPQLFREIAVREIDVAHWLAAGEARRAG